MTGSSLKKQEHQSPTGINKAPDRSDPGPSVLLSLNDLREYEASAGGEVYFRATPTGKSEKYGWVVIVPAGISRTSILAIFSGSLPICSLRRASSSSFSTP